MLPLSSFQLPPLGPVAPPPGVTGALVAAFQTFLVFGRFAGEIDSPAPYSKFAPTDPSKCDDPIPSRLGMTIVYSPAAIVGLYYYLSSPENLAALLLTGHFLKRLAEVRFLHRFSGSMSRSLSCMIATYYALCTWVISAFAMPLSEMDPFFIKNGLFLFVVGEAGNFYHHYLLSSLRSQDTKGKRYVTPRGGLFCCVATPHYLFELVSWLGIAFASQQLCAFLEFLSHTGYLMGRAKNANNFYFDRFSEKEWPRTRKNIFPFLY